MSDAKSALMVVFQKRGSSLLRRPDRELELTPGTIAVYPGDADYLHVNRDRGECPSVRVPLDLLGFTPVQIQRVSAIDLRELTSMAIVLQSVFDAISVAGLSLREEIGLFQVVTDLIRTTLSSAITATRSVESRHPLAEQIVRYVLDNLAEPGLGAARIARGLHISERLLYAEMSRAGIRLASLIQTQRLHRVRDALTAPATAHVPIGVLAQRGGFVSASHFSRVFREEFGVTPREWRRRASEEAAPAPADHSSSTMWMAASSAPAAPPSMPMSVAQ